MNEVELDINSLKRSGTEIARYRIASGERVVIGRALQNGAEILDVPSSGQGRTYRVDAGFSDGGALQAFVEDYLREASRLERCPMDPDAIEATLGDTETEFMEGLAAAIWSR